MPLQRARRAAMDVLPVRATPERPCDEADVADAMATLADALVQLAAALAPLREASPGLDACHARAAGGNGLAANARHAAARLA
jgi:ATP-dependent DNA helicase DinG